jgi:hypothetical protein
MRSLNKTSFPKIFLSAKFDFDLEFGSIVTATASQTVTAARYIGLSVRGFQIKVNAFWRWRESRVKIKGVSVAVSQGH